MTIGIIIRCGCAIKNMLIFIIKLKEIVGFSAFMEQLVRISFYLKVT